MKSVLTLLALSLPALSTAGTEPIYQCLRNGVTVFTDKPDDSSCRAIDLQVLEPDPAEVARLQEKKRADAERERAEREEARQDQLLKAQVEAARAARREADARRRQADRDARGSQQPAQSPYFWPGYWGGPIHPGYPPVNPPGAYPPNPPGPMPPVGTPDYPYAPSRGTVNGR